MPRYVAAHGAPAGAIERRDKAMTDVLATDEPGHTLDIGEGPAGTVLRRVRPGSASTGLTGDDTLPALIADYWVEPARGVPLVYLVFSSPLIDLRDQLVQLFDTIVASVSVLDPAHLGAPATTEEP